ncbi:tripartite tricarboxylate transporter TctB family protein [Propionivibrio dicarboxylicus]|uniref:Tripartite tricarboxylate transporter TctB family protein n=1 Tax=Propionivibrio dicarboxylicus TaxID=83767 RepID=A0A1G8K204_9RHOO|nr:tripartite tricarboxylate transporter TctB family protein [Propionivibrio dicarboxylicus]SDI37475.1 Tripartite tricarboxylate transporter TctB family protein [Propionivibrio dicarboxylicus]
MGLLAGIIPLLLGILACIGAVQLDIGRLSQPGAGLWPFILSIALIVCALLLFVKDVRPLNYDRFSAQSKRVVASALAIAVFVLVFQSLGLVPAVVGLLLFQLKQVGGESWKSAVAVTAGMSALVYGLFSLWLKIPFPGLIS